MTNTNETNKEAEFGGSALNERLAICPCGRTPSQLQLTDNGQGGKWANATGDCCGEWAIEFGTEYFSLDSKECEVLAANEWNSAPRANV